MITSYFAPLADSFCSRHPRHLLGVGHASSKACAHGSTHLRLDASAMINAFSVIAHSECDDMRVAHSIVFAFFLPCCYTNQSTQDLIFELATCMLDESPQIGFELNRRFKQVLASSKACAHGPTHLRLDASASRLCTFLCAPILDLPSLTISVALPYCFRARGN